jgi:hypothetical protein
MTYRKELAGKSEESAEPPELTTVGYQMTEADHNRTERDDALGWLS